MKQRQEHGGDIYRHPGVLDFSVNCNSFGMPDAVREAALRGVEAAQAYPDDRCEELRQAIAEYENLKAEQILCGNGASELICGLVRAIAPSEALLLIPGFSEYERALQAISCKIQDFYWLDAKRHGRDAQLLDTLRATSAELVMFSNPNNPTGLMAGPELLAQIIEICGERGIWLIIDECFLDFAEDAEKHSGKCWLDRQRQLVILKAFTKNFACAGLRVGYCMSMNEQILSGCRMQLPGWNVSIPAQYAGIAAAGQKAWLAQTATAIRKERNWLQTQLESLEFQVFPGAANYLCFAGRTGLYEQCLKKGILIRDCSGYRGLREGVYRICVRTRTENERLLQSLSEQ